MNGQGGVGAAFLGAVRLHEQGAGLQRVEGLGVAAPGGGHGGAVDHGTGFEAEGHAVAADGDGLAVAGVELRYGQSIDLGPDRHNGGQCCAIFPGSLSLREKKQWAFNGLGDALKATTVADMVAAHSINFIQCFGLGRCGGCNRPDCAVGLVAQNLEGDHRKCVVGVEVVSVKLNGERVLAINGLLAVDAIRNLGLGLRCKHDNYCCVEHHLLLLEQHTTMVETTGILGCWRFDCKIICKNGELR